MAERKVVGLSVAAWYGSAETIVAACDDGACFRLVRQFDPDRGHYDEWRPMLPVPGTRAGNNRAVAAPSPEERADGE